MLCSTTCPNLEDKWESLEGLDSLEYGCVAANNFFSEPKMDGIEDLYMKE